MNGEPRPLPEDPSPVKRFRCMCGSNAQEVESRLKTLYAKAWYVSVADYEALKAENARLREALRDTGRAGQHFVDLYYATAEGQRDKAAAIHNGIWGGK